MKFSIKQSELNRGLEPVFMVSTTAGENEFEDLGWVTIEASKDSLVASAYNGKAAIVNKITEHYSFGEAGSPVTLNTKEFMSTVASFSPDEIIDFVITDSEAQLIPQSDSSQMQAVPFNNKVIQVPQFATTFTKQVHINRERFSKAVNKVAAAVGNLKFKPEFFYWIARFSANRIRTVAGDGSRFIIYQIEGENLVDAKGEISFVVHKDFNPIVQKLLAKGPETITFSEYVKKNDEDTEGASTQTVFEIGSIRLMLLAHDPTTKWPNEEKFLVRQNPIKFTVDASEWVYPLNGVKATYNDDVSRANKIHFASMKMDFNKKMIVVEAESTMKSKRKVRISDVDVPEGQEDLEFSCVSDYLKDMLSLCSGEEHMQFEFVDNKAPVIVRYYAKDVVQQDRPVKDAGGFKEECTIFFASFNKKQ